MRILYIDDDADDREMLDLALHKIDPAIQVAFAVNGMAGLHFLKQAQADNELPCLVVLDINMPVMDGKKTLELIRRDLALNDLPVVIFTSSLNSHDKAFFASRANDFISKPLSSSELYNVARQLLKYCA